MSSVSSATFAPAALLDTTPRLVLLLEETLRLTRLILMREGGGGGVLVAVVVMRRARDVRIRWPADVRMATALTTKLAAGMVGGFVCLLRCALENGKPRAGKVKTVVHMRGPFFSARKYVASETATTW